VLTAVAEGRMALLLDDEDRENEGDIVVAAERLTGAHFNFMLSHTRGLVCVPLEAARLRELGIPDMPASPGDEGQCPPFTVTVDLAHGTGSGSSVLDRVECIHHLVSSTAKAGDFKYPGHVMPLRGHPQGLEARRDQTEAAIELVRLAGLVPGAVICGVLAADGDVMRGAELEKFAAEHELPLITVDEVAAQARRARAAIGSSLLVPDDS